MSSPNYGYVNITYIYNNSSNTVSGNFTQNGDGYIANLADSNFPLYCLTPGILVQVKLDKTTNKIYSVFLNFNIGYLYPSSLSSPPISNVTIKGKVIQNNIPIHFNYNMKFQTIEQAYILYSFTPESLLEPIPDYFSQAALNQVAKTRGLTSALLTTLDLGINNGQKTQIAGDVGLIAGHLVSIGEYINKIDNIITKKNKN